MNNNKNYYNPLPIDREPWVSLGDNVSLNDWGHSDEVILNQQNRQIEKYKMYVNSFDFLKDNQIIGDYHEFGCHKVRTFRMALTEARRHNIDYMNFFAYDSFEGLPEASSSPSHALWTTPGALFTSEKDFERLVKEHGLFLDKIKIYKGFYDTLLTKSLQKKILDENNKIAFLCVDCDLYESASPVFAFVEPLIQEGTIIYVDDFFVGYKGNPEKGVARAFDEFRQKSRFKFQRHLDVGWWGRSFICYI